MRELSTLLSPLVLLRSGQTRGRNNAVCWSVIPRRPPAETTILQQDRK